MMSQLPIAIPKPYKVSLKHNNDLNNLFVELNIPYLLYPKEQVKVKSKINKIFRKHPDAFEQTQILVTKPRQHGSSNSFYFVIKNNTYGLIIYLKLYKLTFGNIKGIVPEFSYTDIPYDLREWYNQQNTTYLRMDNNIALEIESILQFPVKIHH